MREHRIKFVFIVLLILLPLHSAGAAEKSGKKAFLFPPLFSVILPGFDQWWEGDYPTAAAYSGVAIAGSMMAKSSVKFDETPENRLTSRDDESRFQLLGAHLYGTAGLLSARESFLNAVRTRKEDFPFITADESTWDVLKAPFKFEYITRPSTFVPLALLVGLLTYEIQHEGYITDSNYRGSDLFFTGAFSYGAATGEEAFFRGYLLPVGQYYTGERYVSNTLQALLFAFAHRITPLPWLQFVSGWWDGYTTQNNGGAISESVFGHFWWDMIAFSASYAFRKPGQETSIQFTPLTLRF